jgi:hypothetical protein
MSNRRKDKRFEDICSLAVMRTLVRTVAPLRCCRTPTTASG